MTEEEFNSIPRLRPERRIRRNYELRGSEIYTTDTHRAKGGLLLIKHRNDVIAKLENIHEEGQSGVTNLLEQFKRHWYALDLQNAAKKVIEACEPCRLYTPQPHNNHLHQIEANYVGHILGIDIVGELNTTLNWGSYSTHY